MTSSVRSRQERNCPVDNTLGEDHHLGPSSRECDPLEELYGEGSITTEEYLVADSLRWAHETLKMGGERRQTTDGHSNLELPTWVIEQSQRDAAELQGRCADAVGRVTDELVDRLIKAGGLNLAEDLRERLHGVLIALAAVYGPMSFEVGRQELLADLGFAEEADAFATKMEHVLHRRWLFAGDPRWDLPMQIREFARSIRPDSYLLRAGRRGRRRRKEDDIAVGYLATEFCALGGRLAVSRNGPFTRFLKVAWEALSPDARPASPQAFVDHAKRMLPSLREREAELRGRRERAERG